MKFAECYPVNAYNQDTETTAAVLQTELGAPVDAEVVGSKGATESRLSPAAQHPGTPALVEPLTAREQEVLQLIADGLTNRQIAEELIISVGTVKFYTAQIYGKLGVHSRTQAVARAKEFELLT